MTIYHKILQIENHTEISQDYFNNDEYLHLISLTIYYHIKDDAKLPESLFNLKIKKLEIHGEGNRIINLDEISKMTQLETLTLIELNTDISFITPLLNLKKLWLDTLPISSINSICGLVQLKLLNISNCKLKEIPKCIPNLTDLENVIFNNNEIVDIDSLCFLPKLHNLSLKENKITEIPECLGLDQKHLVFVDLRGNPLQKFGLNLVKPSVNISDIKYKNLRLLIDQTAKDVPHQYFHYLLPAERKRLKFETAERYTKLRKILPTNWREACKVGSLLGLKTLQEFASKHDIKIYKLDGTEKTKRELCKEFAVETRIDKTLKETQINLGNLDFPEPYLKTPEEETNAFHEWVLMQNGWLELETCHVVLENGSTVVKFCEIIKGYTHKGDVWLNKFLREQYLDLELVFKESRNHPFSSLMINSENEEMTEFNADFIMDSLFDISNILNNIILSAPTFNEYFWAYRSEKDMHFKWEKDKIYTTKGFYSATYSKQNALDFGNILLKILVPPKSHCCNAPYNCSFWGGEEELLFPHGSTFYIKSVNTVKPEFPIITLILIGTPKKEIAKCWI